MVRFGFPKRRRNDDPDPSIRKGDRRAILLGVYEDNLRTAQKLVASGARTRARSAHRFSTTWKSVAGVLCLFTLAGVLYGAVGAASQDETSDAEVVERSLNVSPLRVQSGPWSYVDRSPEYRPGVADLYGLQIQTIVIDPGHGGRDPGAVGQGGLMEKDVTLDVAHRLKRLLERHPGYRILLTREQDATKLLRERVEFANEQKADLFISLHVNAIPDDSVTPIETYYYGPGSDARAARLAARENRNSGFSVAEFTSLTQQLGLELKIQESRELAHSIQDGLYRNMRHLNDQISDWGVKTGDFMVLLGVGAPSVLVEIGSISNRTEETNLSTDSYRAQVALFLEEALVGYLKQHAHENQQLHYVSQDNEE